jgi:hypothetical protein
MGLAAFIRANEASSFAARESFAQTYLPSAAHMDPTALRDHILGLLRFIADDLDTFQNEREKARDRDRKREEGMTAVPKLMPPFGLREASIRSRCSPNFAPCVQVVVAACFGVCYFHPQA